MAERDVEPTPVELSPRRGPADGGPHAPADPVGGGRGRWTEAISAASTVANVHLTRRNPISLVQFVTRRCNARCSFCFIDFDHPEPKRLELSLEEIEALTKTVGRDLRNVNLTGGEPFLRSDLPEIVDAWFRNTAIRSVYITTNGSFPDRVERLARTVSRRHPDRLLIVSLSIDGFPDDHDRIRRIPGLFDRVIATYRSLQDIPGVMSNVAVTVSHENHAAVPALYEHLVGELGVRAVTAILVRDEGVYTVPDEARAGVVGAYRWLTDRLVEDQASGRLDGYDRATLQGRLMNRKNRILYDILSETYLEPRYVSRCHAGALFGVVDANGDVAPCEVLDRPLGNLRDHGMDFGRLWRDEAAAEARRWIHETKCHCSYECAWAFNILANARYQPQLISAAFGR